MQRINVHKDRTDRLQEMFITLSEDYPPEYHIGKDESLHILSGACEVHLHPNVVLMGNYASGLPFYIRIPAGREHSLEVSEDEDGKKCLRFKETVSGPWYKEDTVRTGTNGRIGLLVEPPTLLRTSDESFHATDEIITVSKKEIDILKAAVSSTARQRVRLCCHKNVSEKLHEMFIVYMDKTIVQPHKHLWKDESFHVIEGAADIVFYTDTGDVTSIVSLDEKNSFTRIPADVYHTMIMRSDLLVFHNSTPGPFIRDHTQWATWWTR